MIDLPSTYPSLQREPRPSPVCVPRGDGPISGSVGTLSGAPREQNENSCLQMQKQASGKKEILYQNSEIPRD